MWCIVLMTMNPETDKGWQVDTIYGPYGDWALAQEDSFLINGKLVGSSVQFRTIVESLMPPQMSNFGLSGKWPGAQPHSTQPTATEDVHPSSYPDDAAPF